MDKVFIDTNVWMRFFIKTDLRQYEGAIALISAIEQGSMRAYTSTIVLLEIAYVAEKVYKIPHEDVLNWFSVIQKIRSLTLIEKTSFPLALQYHKRYGVKLADCIITSQISQDMMLITFDKEFRKIKGLNVATPQEILKKL